MLELISCFHITTIVSFIVYDNWQTDRGRSFFSFKTAMTATRSANSVRKHINGYARRRIGHSQSTVTPNWQQAKQSS